MHSTLLIFLDGVGIGRPDPDINPFFRDELSFLKELFGSIPSLDNQFLTSSDGLFLFPSDAVMGVQGLPQSGTGQTSIFCGFNAPEYLGQHFGPFPHTTLIPRIKNENIFHSFLGRNMKVTFANAYPRVFFDYLKSGKQRLSVTSLSCRLSGVPLNGSRELRNGSALSAEIDNYRWKEKLHYKISEITPELAAKRLIRISKKNHFTLFEYFLTDHLGHGRNKDEMNRMLHSLNRFLLHILRVISDEGITLIICSDHGNLEDLSVKSHTMNPALTITAGKHAERLSERIRKLSDIKPAILELYE